MQEKKFAFIWSKICSLKEYNNISDFSLTNLITKKAALVECWAGDKNWKTLQWAPRKSDTSDGNTFKEKHSSSRLDMLLGIDDDYKLTLFNLKTKEGKKWGNHSISCGK